MPAPQRANALFSPFLWAGSGAISVAPGQISTPSTSTHQPTHPVLSLYDRHVARRFALQYLALVAALIVFFVILHYVEFVDDFMDRDATKADVWLVYYPNFVPEIIRLISPLALFLACVFLTGRLAQSMQLAALQTSGVRLFRIMRPFLVVGIAVTAFMFWFNGWIVPEANRTRIAFEVDYTKNPPTQTEYNNIHRQTSRESVLSVGFFDRGRQEASTISLTRFDASHRLVHRIDAERMLWIDSLAVWRLVSAVQRTFSDSGVERRTDRATFDTTLTLLPQDMARTDGDVEAMTITGAARYIDALRRSGADNMGLPLVVYYGKFAYPFSNLILVLLGVPLAAVRRRGGQGPILGLGLLLAFGYLTLMKVLEPFGYSGLLPPLLAAILPHAIMLAGALVVLRGTRK